MRRRQVERGFAYGFRFDKKKDRIELCVSIFLILWWDCVSCLDLFEVHAVFHMFDKLRIRLIQVHSAWLVSHLLDLTENHLKKLLMRSAEKCIIILGEERLTSSKIFKSERAQNNAVHTFFVFSCSTVQCAVCIVHIQFKQLDTESVLKFTLFQCDMVVNRVELWLIFTLSLSLAHSLTLSQCVCVC